MNGPVPGSWAKILTRDRPGVLARLDAASAGGYLEPSITSLATGGKRQRGERLPARPAPTVARPVEAVAGQNRVDPVAQHRPAAAARPSKPKSSSSLTSHPPGEAASNAQA